jgi:hypothetical protein
VPSLSPARTPFSDDLLGGLGCPSVETCAIADRECVVHCRPPVDGDDVYRVSSMTATFIKVVHRTASTDS